MRHFYVVWNPKAGPPSYRHEDYASAVKEARRLAETNPGQDFIVLCALTIAHSRVATVLFDLEGPITVPAHLAPDDGIPF